jgi:CRISPR-associated protein Cas2
LVDPEKWAQLRHRLLTIYEPTEDSLRFYFLGAKWRGRVQHHGIKKVVDPEGILLA